MSDPSVPVQGRSQRESIGGLSPARVLHGVTGAAGQPRILASAMRELGAVADSVMIGRNPLGFRGDLTIEPGSDAYSAYQRFLADAVHRYDVFHYYFRPLFFFRSDSLAFPTALDLLVLRAAGKTVIMHYRGSEVRTAEAFRHLSPFNYVDENPSKIFSKFPTDVVQSLTQFVRSVANAVLVPDEELQSYVPHARIVRRAVDLAELSPVEPRAQGRPLLVHAPTRPVVKGTAYVLEAVEQLWDEGYEFDFKLVRDLSHAEAIGIYRSADIIIDQLRIGWYGVLAVEGMALGKAVVAYVREDLVHHLGTPLPLITATPLDLADRLRELLDHPARMREVGGAGRAFVEKHHDAARIAAQLLELYRNPAVASRSVDVGECLEFLASMLSLTTPERATADGRHEPSNWEKFKWVRRNLGNREAMQAAARVIASRVRSS